MIKSLDRPSTVDVVPVESVTTFGNINTWQLITEVTSTSCTKTTKAMELKGIGCVVSVSTEIRNVDGQVIACSESTTFVPKTRIEVITDKSKTVIARNIVPISN